MLPRNILYLYWMPRGQNPVSVKWAIHVVPQELTGWIKLSHGVYGHIFLFLYFRWHRAVTGQQQQITGGVYLIFQVVIEFRSTCQISLFINFYEYK